MSSELRPVRSALFVPGDDLGKLEKAAVAGADAVVVDLEDAVAPAAKPMALKVSGGFLADPPPGPRWILRMNAPATPFFAADLILAAAVRVDALLVPKATLAALAAFDQVHAPLIALIETGRGLADVRGIAADPRVVGLMLGAVDLGVELGLTSRADGLELLHARAEIVLASALGECRAPIDGPRLDFRDLEGLASEAHLARSLGFGGKACIHPVQVETINAIFSPTAHEVEHAHAIIEASEAAASDGVGVAALNGTMIDAAVVEHARRILRLVNL